MQSDDGTLSPGDTLVVGDLDKSVVNFGSISGDTGNGSIGDLGGAVITAAQSSTSPFVIDIGMDSSITTLETSNPALYGEIVGAIDAAVTFYETNFVNPMTITIDFGFGKIDGQNLEAGALSESETTLVGPLSYSTVRTALIDSATSADDETAVASLGLTDPTGGGHFVVSTAEAEALGIKSGANFAGWIGLSDTAALNYSTTDRAVSGEYDVVGALEHEISEVMGRIDLVGQSIGTVLSDAYAPLDLYRYSGLSERVLAPQETASLSFDGGRTLLYSFNTLASGDVGDWASSVTDNSYDAFSTAGVENEVTSTDLEEMDVLGYTRASPACFASGTRIRTARGDVRVEDLLVGDIVHARHAGPTPVRWIGHRLIDCRRHPDPRQVSPVRIVSDAFGAAQPSRDVLLSPDHAVLMDQSLIPIRLLVNGTTIRQETGVAEIRYFHVELPRHDLLIADGLAVESYLDTGNRGLFANADAPVTLHPNLVAADARSLREQASCLPLLCDPSRVEPFWHMLSERARCLGFALPMVSTTHDPELGIASGGQHFAPVMRHGRRYTFVVPSLQPPLRLLSRFAIPSDLRPWIDDRRRLGVMVQRIVAHRGTTRVDLAMDDERLSDGWWAIERDRASIWRWTNGDAALPSLGEGPGMIEVWLGETIAYPLAPFAETERGHFAKHAA